MVCIYIEKYTAGTSEFFLVDFFYQWNESIFLIRIHFKLRIRTLYFRRITHINFFKFIQVGARRDLIPSVGIGLVVPIWKLACGCNPLSPLQLISNSVFTQNLYFEGNNILFQILSSFSFLIDSFRTFLEMKQRVILVSKFESH